MHFPHVLLFGAVALLASSDARLHSIPVNLTSLEPNGITSARPDDAQSGQRAKDGDPVDEDDNDEGEEEDERIFDFKGLLGIEKLQRFLQPKVTMGKLGTWISQEKSPDYVFEKFGFHKPGKEHFDNPDFNVWAAYTKLVVKDDPEKAMLAMLRKYHTEEELVRKLAAAKEGDATNAIFSRLYAEWMAEGKTPLDVFMAFGLHEAKTVDAKYTSFARWLDFIDTQNKDQGNAGLIMLTAVAGHVSYSDLIQLLGKAKTEAAQIARNMLPRFWSKNGPNEAFKEAALKGDGELLSSAGFLAWIKFMSSHNKANPSQKASVFETMERFFGEEQLTTVLITASKNSVSTELSKELLSKQIAQWKKKASELPDLKDTGYTAKAILKKLQLDGDKNVVTNPLFSLWRQYSIETAQGSSMIEALLHNYKSDVLAKMILEAKTIEGSELTAKRVEAQLFAHLSMVAKTYSVDPDTVARSAFKLGPKTEDDEPKGPLKGMYDDFMVFAKTSMNLKVDAAVTPLETVQKKLDDSRLLNEKMAELTKPDDSRPLMEKVAEAREVLRKEEAARVRAMSRKTLQDFLMEPH
uniref:Uncharacterized protein n=1 Tax=Peronospora matthiolae TaxID=2874970 RepID=A0AAV1UT18_9STRA